MIWCSRSGTKFSSMGLTLCMGIEFKLRETRLLIFSFERMAFGLFERYIEKILKKLEGSFLKLNILPISSERMAIALLEIKEEIVMKKKFSKALKKAFYQATGFKNQVILNGIVSLHFFGQLSRETKRANEEAREIAKQAIKDRLNYISTLRGFLISEGFLNTPRGVNEILMTVDALPDVICLIIFKCSLYVLPGYLGCTSNLWVPAQALEAEISSISNERSQTVADCRPRRRWICKKTIKITFANEQINLHRLPKKI